jgi:large subunit ribosomal protein L16
MNLLQPKKLKYKKYHKKLSSFTIKNYYKKELDFGTFGLKVMEHSRISARQIEAMRKIIRRITKRSGLL